MPLALFDLDNTLLNGDSDYLWGQFLAEQGLVASADYEQQNKHFYSQYQQGKLDIMAFLDFSLKPLAEIPMDHLLSLRQQFIKEKIQPIISQAAFERIDKHRTAHDTLVIITATNSFITAPIAKIFGIDNLLATEAEKNSHGYSGKVAGIPCFQQGKVKRLEAWMSEMKLNLQNSWFYSDSHNDLPLLNKVTHPIAVDPDPQLHAIAEQQGWPIISLR